MSALLPVVRVAILVVMFFVTLGLIVALARPETGWLEKGVLAGAVVLLIALARPVQRIG